MDNCVAAVTVAVAAYRSRKQRSKHINDMVLVLKLFNEDDAIVPREHISCLCNVRRAAAITCSVHKDYYQMLLEAACTVLFEWHIAAFELHSCDCASPKRSKTTCCATPQLKVGTQGRQ